MLLWYLFGRWLRSFIFHVRKLIYIFKYVSKLDDGSKGNEHFSSTASTSKMTRNVRNAASKLTEWDVSHVKPWPGKWGNLSLQQDINHLTPREQCKDDTKWLCNCWCFINEIFNKNQIKGLQKNVLCYRKEILWADILNKHRYSSEKCYFGVESSPLTWVNSLKSW